MLADARESISHKKIGVNMAVFANTGSIIADPHSDLDQLLLDLDGEIANMTTATALDLLLDDVIAVANDHLASEFFDESSTTCDDRGITVGSGRYDDCRWIYDHGEANILFDNQAVALEILVGETLLSKTLNPACEYSENDSMFFKVFTTGQKMTTLSRSWEGVVDLT